MAHHTAPREDHEEFHPHGGDWLRDIVFGLNDGLVTTLVFVMAVGAVAPVQLVSIGLVELLSGGVAMALGDYLSSYTANDVLTRRIATERHEISAEPEEERAEPACHLPGERTCRRAPRGRGAATDGRPRSLASGDGQ